MNSKYKKSFNLIAPSDDSVERIFNMTSKKRISFKPLLAAMLIIAIIASCMVTANAMTDGEVFETIGETIETVKIIVNGKEYKDGDDVKFEKETVTNENGKTVKHYKVEIPDEEGNSKGYIEWEVEPDGSASIGSSVEPNGETSVEVYDEELGANIELNVPTTAVN